MNDAFDIHGGQGHLRRPANYMQGAYQMVPVGITVEGANILTRTLITFAQGALRSATPISSRDRSGCRTRPEHGVAAFERAFDGHVAFALSNATSALSSTM